MPHKEAPRALRRAVQRVFRQEHAAVMLQVNSLLHCPELFRLLRVRTLRKCLLLEGELSYVLIDNVYETTKIKFHLKKTFPKQAPDFSSPHVIKIKQWNESSTLLHVVAEASWDMTWQHPSARPLIASRRESSAFSHDDLCCPLTLDTMHTPVILLTQAQRSYERLALRKWLKKAPNRDPVTGQEQEQPLQYIPNLALRALIGHRRALHGNNEGSSDESSVSSRGSTASIASTNTVKRNDSLSWQTLRSAITVKIPSFSKLSSWRQSRSSTKSTTLIESLPTLTTRRRKGRLKPERSRQSRYDNAGNCVYLWEPSSDEEEEDLTTVNSSSSSSLSVTALATAETTSPS